jgi:sulfur transfer complex TusBCD TusB component (DsrH family)
MRTSMRAIVISTFAVIVLGVFPVIAERDSYPHSHLPMFSVRRTEIARIDTAIGLDENKEIVRLSPRLIADTDEVIMAKDAVVNAIRTKRTTELCKEIAQRISKRRNDITQVQVVTEVYNAVAWFKNEKNPLNVEIHSECDVP